MVKIKFAKMSVRAVIPTKRKEDAGYDVYADVIEPIVIYPGQTALIPTSICSVIPDGYCMILKERGSTGVRGIGQRSGVIDSGFRGEWKVPITNHSNKTLVIGPRQEDAEYVTYYSTDKAICQALLIPVPESCFEEVSLQEILSTESQRMQGEFGSTNKK